MTYNTSLNLAMALFSSLSTRLLSPSLIISLEDGDMITPC